MVTLKNKNIHLEYHKELNYNFVGWNVRLCGGLAEYYLWANSLLRYVTISLAYFFVILLLFCLCHYAKLPSFKSVRLSRLDVALHTGLV